MIAGDDLLIDLSSHLLPATSFYVSYIKDATGKFMPKTANIGYVNLMDAEEYLFAMALPLSPEFKKMITGLKVTGALQNAAMVFADDWTDFNKASIKGSFSDLSFSPWKQVPGVKNLSGKLSWNGKEGELALQSNHVQLKYDAVFMNSVDVDQLTGNIKWQQDENKLWLFSIANLQILNSDLVANIKGALTIEADGAAVSDLTGHFVLQKAGHVARYLPLKIFDAGLVKWLRASFSAGSVQSGELVLKGKLSDFPFDNNNGTFFISGLVNNIDLQFAPDWPALNRISGKLVFSGRQMTVDVTQAETLGIALGQVHASIPYFGEDKPAILYVTSNEIETDFSQGLDYVHKSPLEASIGKMFTGTEASGLVSLVLSLTVPLSDPDKIQVKGDLKLKDNDVKLVPWKLNLGKVSGHLQFTEDTTTAKQISALLFNKPVTIGLSTIKKSKTINVARASFANHLSIVDLEDWLKMPFSKVVKGDTNVEGYIDFSPKTPIEIHLKSNLVGLAIDMPDDYSKKTNAARDFVADITVQEQQPLRIKAGYGKLLSTALILKRSQDTFKLTSINLRLGGGDAAWPVSDGLYISGNIPQLDWVKIKQYASKSTGTKSEGLSDYPLRGIDVQIGKLNLPGLVLSQTRLELTPANNYCDIDITNSNIEGELHVPVNFTAKNTLTAKFNKLYLQASKSDGSAKLVLDVKNLPGISLIANDASYNGIRLGRVTLNTIPTGNGASIQALRFNAPYMELQSTGVWTQSGTRLQGKLMSSNVGEFLNSAGMNAHNVIAGKGSIDFNLNWSGAFFAPALNSMNGSLALKIGAGRIVDVGETSDAKLGVGRLLSIFSLQTIPKRLTLNFSDLFQKGYSFDSLTGDFSLKNGNAFTNNMSFKGTVARVDIDGRIGLSNQDLDFILSVTPGDVTSSLPVAATLLGGPVGGIAALAVNTVIGSQISKAATHYYQVRGSWSNPTWAPAANTVPSQQRTR